MSKGGSMNKVKKVAAIIIMLTFIGTLSACSSNSQETSTIVPTPVTEEGKVLVAYYSYSGNTEREAKRIAEITGAELAKIDRAEAYPEDFYDIAEKEIEDEVHPEITLSIESIDEYETIFVGYPIWFDEIPAVISTFLEENDFAGKRIIPFCTSSSDEIDNSLHRFTELCRDATIEKGMRITEDTDIPAWIDGLSLGTQKNSTAKDSNDEKESNILITYFTVMMDDGVDAVGRASRVQTDTEVLGNTEYLSYLIKQQLGGDLFQIETVDPYPTDSMDALLERAHEEKQNDERPELTSLPENLERYDIVFIGFPNWNADLPMPVYTFLDSVDLSGKTIVPFVVHGGSSFSGTIDIIEELEPNATVLQDGFSIARDDVIPSGTEVLKWAAGLKLE